MSGAARRTYGLDLLRAVAIAIVLGNHLLLGFLHRHLPVGIDGWVAHASTSAILSIEWLFVLSGFLIGNMMVRILEGPGSFWWRARQFWLRRWFRTIPAYYLFVVVNVLLVAWGIAPGRFSWDYLFFAQNLLGPERAEPFFAEAWSLALDEWFYLVMPLLVGAIAWAGRRRNWGLHRTFLLATAVLIVVPMVARATVIPTDYLDWDARVRRVTLMHLDATGWGVLAAVVNRWSPQWWQRHRASKALAGVALTVFGIWMLTGHYTEGLDARLVATLPRVVNVVALGLLPAGAFLAVPWIAALRGDAVTGRVAGFVATYSYSIYLSHVPLLFVLLHVVGPAGSLSDGEVALASLGWLVVVLAVSVTLYHAFEKPVSDLRERFTRKVDANPFAP